MCLLEQLRGARTVGRTKMLAEVEERSRTPQGGAESTRDRERRLEPVLRVVGPSDERSQHGEEAVYRPKAGESSPNHEHLPLAGQELGEERTRRLGVFHSRADLCEERDAERARAVGREQVEPVRGKGAKLLLRLVDHAQLG